MLYKLSSIMFSFGTLVLKRDMVKFFLKKGHFFLPWPMLA